MKKNSIFSREYEKKIRRKRFVLVLFMLLISLLFVYYVINFKNINQFVRSKYIDLIYKEEVELNNSIDENKKNNDIVNNNETEEKLSEVSEVIIQDDVSLDYNEVSLFFGEQQEIKVLYDRNEDNLEFIGISKVSPQNFKFNISPSKDKILVYDELSEDTYLLDKSLQPYKLDSEYFYSNSARTRFYKEDIRSRYENYPWYKDPTFLDDNTIIYITNLPWFGSNENYIWKTDITDVNNISHVMLGLSGQNINFAELTDEGIKVNINNEIKLLTFSFVLK